VKLAAAAAVSMCCVEILLQDWEVIWATKTDWEGLRLIGAVKTMSAAFKLIG
jgi:hypothetical protein